MKHLGSSSNQSPGLISQLLCSDAPASVLKGLELLNAVGTSQAWRDIVGRSIAYSICCLCRDGSLPFPAALNAGFTPYWTAALTTACEQRLLSLESRRDLNEFDRLKLCQSLSPVGLEIFDATAAVAPTVVQDDTAFITAAVGPTLGQAIWRDLALTDKLALYYEPNSLDGDRLMPDWQYCLAGEDGPTLQSFGCQFICAPGESHFLQWIAKESYINPEAIRTSTFWSLYFEGCWHEDFLPRFSAQGLVFAALEGLCLGHLSLTDTGKFDDKILAAFTDYDTDAESVRVTVLNKPIHEGVSLGEWAYLSPAKKSWLIDCFLSAATADKFAEAASLAKHVLSWLTLHPATSAGHRDRLTKLGFGVIVRRPKETAAGRRHPTDAKLKKPDKSRLTRLRKIVRAWEVMCDAEFPDGLERNQFLAAHYAQLAIRDEVVLTRSGWDFLGELEDDILAESYVKDRPVVSKIGPQRTEVDLSAEWHIAVDGAQSGPHTLEQVHAMIQGGQVIGDTLAWKAGLERWVKVKQCTELAHLLAPTTPPEPLDP